MSTIFLKKIRYLIFKNQGFKERFAKIFFDFFSRMKYFRNGLRCCRKILAYFFRFKFALELDFVEE